MRTPVIRRGRPTVLVALLMLGGSVAALSGCKTADEWVVIHANRMRQDVPATASAEEQANRCREPAGKEVASLPYCVIIDTGQKLGFVNYYRDGDGPHDVIVSIKGADISKSTFTVRYSKRKVVKVLTKPSTPPVVTFEVVGLSGEHGGPIILPKLP